MKYKILGQTGIKVSRICFGTLTMGPLQANLSLAGGAGLIRYALEQGVNFFDTAKLYGTYPYLKKALQGWPQPVVISSKSYDYTWEGMKKSLEEARVALDRDTIDIFCLHEQESELTLAGHRPALEYLEEAKTRGLIRAVGVSTHTVKVVKAAAQMNNIEVIHPLVNMRGLGLLDGTLPQILAAVKDAYENGKGLYGMKALGGGNLISQAESALNFAFTMPYLHSVALGCKTKEELDFNIAVLEGRIPSPELVRKVRKTPRRLHFEDWCAGCGACVKKCPSGLLALRNGKAALVGDGCLFCGYCAAVCPDFVIKVI